MPDAQHVHAFRETDRECIPDHGVPVCCPRCREVCACGMASCGHTDISHGDVATSAPPSTTSPSGADSSRDC